MDLRFRSDIGILMDDYIDKIDLELLLDDLVYNQHAYCVLDYMMEHFLLDDLTTECLEEIKSGRLELPDNLGEIIVSAFNMKFNKEYNYGLIFTDRSAYYHKTGRDCQAIEKFANRYNDLLSSYLTNGYDVSDALLIYESPVEEVSERGKPRVQIYAFDEYPYPKITSRMSNNVRMPFEKFLNIGERTVYSLIS